MDEGGHRDNGQHKSDMYKPAAHNQWLLQQSQSMKHIMSLMAERDAAIQERNMAINEKNKACEERDLAIMQRDTVIKERNEAIIEHDNALAALQFRQISVNSANFSPSGCQNSQDIKQQPQQNVQASYDGSDGAVPETLLVTPVPVEHTKSGKFKRPKDPNATSAKKTTKSGRKVKRPSNELNKSMLSKPEEWMEIQNIGGDESDDDYKPLRGSKHNRKGTDRGLNQVVFEESTMPPPVCSCTGIYQQCYKWGSGGWQSSCCTTTMSMHPLPAMPNKRSGRVGGRKMSASAFGKLLSRLAAEGHDMSTPVDLKDHWAKHGTNRYMIIR